MTTLGNIYHKGLDIAGRLFEHAGSPDHVFRPTATVGDKIHGIRYTPVGNRLTEPAHVTLSLQEASSYVSHRGRYIR